MQARILSRLCLFSVSLFLSVSGYASAKTTQPSGKKGIGLAESQGLGDKQLKSLKVHWYYNWGSQSKIATVVEFVPMIFSKRAIDAAVNGKTVLGFNEPDNSKQSNMTAQEAIALWPKVVSKGQRVGGPAMAGNPLKGEWLTEFMKAKLQVDFITVHWYKGANSKKFIKDMQEIHEHYKKPLWVTEFAPQTAGSSRENPSKYSQSEVDAFIRETVQWMEQSPFVERYAWHDSKVGTSSLFDKSGELTASGQTYAAAH